MKKVKSIMKKHLIIWRTISLLTLYIFISPSAHSQEGTKQFMPISASEQNYLCIEPGTTNYTHFATYGCEVYERLNVFLNAGEVLHIGMRFDNNAGTSRFTIKDPNDVAVTSFNDIPVPNAVGSGYIGSYDRAIMGPNGTFLNNTEITLGYDAESFTASDTGNYYIEFNTPNNQRTSIRFFDVTVTDDELNIITNADNPNRSAGRLWSNTWQFNTGSFTQDPVNTDFYVFTSDEFVNKVKYQMYPYVFSFAVNSYGIDDSYSNPVEKAQSREGKFNNIGEYKIFLNDPDHKAFTGTSLPPPSVKVWLEDTKIYDYDYDREPQLLNINADTLTLNKNNGACTTPSRTLFRIETNISGYTIVLLDLNDDGVYTANSVDRSLYIDLTEGMNYVLWDFKDDSGNDVGDGLVSASATFLGRGPAHFPIFDAEALSGIETASIRPFNKLGPTLYWDDNIIDAAGEWGDNDGTMDETVVTQLKINAGIDRLWTYFGASGFQNGNNNTLNSWFNAIDLGMSTIPINIATDLGKCDNGDAPIIDAIYKSTPLNLGFNFTTTDFEEKFFDLSAGIDSIKILSLPANGTLELLTEELLAPDSISYVQITDLEFIPETDWGGETSFDYSASNGTYWAETSSSVFIKVNTDPSITPFSDTSICANVDLEGMDFTVSDAEADVNDISVIAYSHNTRIVSNQNITISGTGANRTLSISPNTDATGSAIIYVEVDDGYSQVIENFTLFIGPSIEIQGDTTLCSGVALALSAEEPGASYLWQDPSGDSWITKDIAIASGSIEFGTYSLQVTKAGCSHSGEFEVSESPLVSFTGETSACLGETISLSATETVAQSYTWRQGGTFEGNAKEFEITNLSAGDATNDWTLQVSKEGCTNTSDPFSISVSSTPSNALTLTGGTVEAGENGIVTILSSEGSTSYQAYIGATEVGDPVIGDGFDVSISIPPAQLSIGDNVITVLASNGGCSSTLLNTATVTVNLPTISVNDVSVAEGADGSTVNLNFEVSLNYYSLSTITVDYTTQDNTALVADNDYTALATTELSFSSGETTKIVSVSVNGDFVFEGDESLYLNLSNPGNATISDTQGLGTITEDDGAPTITIEDANAAEGSIIPFTLNLSNPSAEDITLTLNLTDITATGASGGTGADYDNDNIVVTIPAGQVTSTINVPTAADLVDEPNETFTLGILSVDAGTVNPDISDNGTGTINDDDAAPLIAISDASETEGSNVQFSVNIGTASSEDLTITFDLTNGTAVGASGGTGADYDNDNIQITIPAGTITSTLNVPTSSDLIDEPNETFTLGILSVDAGTADTDISDEATGTINDDDDAPTITLDDAVATEGDDVQFDVNISNPSSADITITLNLTGGTAIGASGGIDADYDNDNIQITIPAGQTTLTVNVPSTSDLIDEPDETFILGILSVDAGTADADLTDTATGTISDDDDAPSITIEDANATEGTNVSFTVNLSNPSSEDIQITFDLTDVSASGASGGTSADYDNDNIQITLLAGATSAKVDVPTSTDLLDEPNETFTLGILSVDAGTADTDISDEATGTINDDDDTPIITIADANAIEGSNIQFTVDIVTASAEDLTVTFDLTDVTASGASGGSDADYDNDNIQITIPAGATTATVEIPTTSDIVDEPNETFTIGILSVDAGTADADISDEAIGTINDDDNAPTITINDSDATEGSDIEFTVNLTNPSSEDLIITFDLTDVTATGASGGIGGDYDNDNIQITIPSGSTNETINIPTTEDIVDEDNENFTLGIVSVDAGTADTDLSDSGNGIIFDDDGAPVITIDDAFAAEGSVIQFSVNLTSISTGDITVTLDFSDETASGTSGGLGGDYDNDNLQITIPAGMMSATAEVSTTDDNTHEPDETFIIGIVSVDAGTADTDLSDEAVGTINENDYAPTISLSDADATEGENVEFTVNLSNPSSEDLTITLDLTDGTATGSSGGTDADYNSDNIQITIPAGQILATVNVPTTSDLIDETDEQFTIGILSIDAGTADPDISDEATGTINDDDGAPQISIEDASADEGNVLEFIVNLSNPTTEDVVLTLNLTDGTAVGSASGTDADYDNDNIQVTIPAGQMTTTASVASTQDSEYEEDETFTMGIASIEAGTVDPDLSDVAIGTIINDDEAPNQPPVAVDDAVSTQNGTASGDLLENDTDPDGDPLQITITPITQPENGTVVINPDGTFIYTPDDDFTGTDTFVYEVCDDGTPPACDEATVTITVTETNQPPVATDDAASTENGTASGDLLENDTDPDGDPLQITTTPISQPENGTVVINTDGTFIYTPDDDFTGTDTFVYEVCDDGTPPACDQATVTITVIEGNQPPIAVDDELTVVMNDTLTGTNLLANDSDPDGDNLTINTTPVVDPEHGTVLINPDGTYTYIPDEDFIGSDSFEYEVCDDASPASCETAVVNIEVLTNDTDGDGIPDSEEGDGDCDNDGIENVMDTDPCPAGDIFIPEGFSPNSDGQNDYFEIPGIEQYNQVSIQIFNRWGNVIYKNDIYENDWDGTSNVNMAIGSDLPTGTYFYLLEIKDTNEKLSGYVYLNR